MPGSSGAGKCVCSRPRKSLGKLGRRLSEKLKSSPGKDNIYSVSLVLFHSSGVNPSFHTNLLFTFVAGDLARRYLSQILCVIIFQLQIITGRHGPALASLFITLSAGQSIFPAGAGLSQGQGPGFIAVIPRLGVLSLQLFPRCYWSLWLTLGGVGVVLPKL